jgi:hypothetical protein
LDLRGKNNRRLEEIRSFIIYIFHQISRMIGSACSTHVIDEKFIQYSGRKTRWEEKGNLSVFFLEETFKMYLGEIVCENVDWINLAPVSDQVPMAGSCAELWSSVKDG